MKTLIKTVEGFDIYFEALEEHISLFDLFEEEEVEELSEDIDNGSLVYFCAKVTAEKAGLELSDDYLGGCIYKSEEEFYQMEGDYFDDMVNIVVEEAKKELPKIIKELQTV